MEASELLSERLLEQFRTRRVDRLEDGTAIDFLEWLYGVGRLTCACSPVSRKNATNQGFPIQRPLARRRL